MAGDAEGAAHLEVAAAAPAWGAQPLCRSGSTAREGTVDDQPSRHKLSKQLHGLLIRAQPMAGWRFNGMQATAGRPAVGEALVGRLLHAAKLPELSPL